MKKLVFSLFITGVMLTAYSCEDLTGDGDVKVTVKNSSGKDIVLLYSCKAHQDDDWPLFKQTTRKLAASSDTTINPMYFAGVVRFSYIIEENGVNVFKTVKKSAEEAKEYGHEITE